MAFRLFSKLIFIKNFIYFLLHSKIFSIFYLKNIKRKGNGLSITLILNNLFVLKIKNKIREKNSIKTYNYGYSKKIFYPKNKFEFEFKVLAKLNALNLSPKPLEYTEKYLLMEYIRDSTSFLEFKKANFNNILDIIDGIEKLHKNGIFHPDLNPGNILILKNGSINFIDFEYSYIDIMTLDEKILFDYSIFCYKLYKFRYNLWKIHKEKIIEILLNKGLDIKSFILLNLNSFNMGFCDDLR